MKNVETLNINLNKAEEAVKKLDGSLQDLNSTAKKTEKSIENMEDSVENLNDIQMDSVEITENIARASAGLAGSFEIVQGSLHLMGIESENAEKAIQDMMAVMQITQGFQAIAEGVQSYKKLKDMILATTVATKLDTKATAANTTAKSLSVGVVKKLNTVLKANPWVAIASAVVAVTGALTFFIKKSSKAAEEQRALAQANKEVEDSLNFLNKETENHVTIMEAEGKSTLEILNYKRAQAKAAYEEAESYSQRVLNAKKYNKEDRENAAKTAQEKYDILQQLNTQIVAEEIKLKNEKLKIEQQDKDNSIKLAQDKAREIVAITKQLNDELKDLQFENSLFGLNEEDKEHARLEKVFRDRLLTAKENYKQGLVDEETYNKLQNEILKNYLYERDLLIKQYDEKDKEEAKERKEQQIQDLIDNFDEKIAVMKERSAVFMDSLMLDEDPNESLKLGIETQSQVIELILEQIDNMKKAGLDTTAIESQLVDEMNQKTALEVEQNQLKLDALNETFEKFNESFSELNSQGGISNEWADVLSNFQSGLEAINNSLNKSGKSWKNYGQLATAGIGMAAGMLNALAEQQDASSKKGFEKQKKLQIASATMSMLNGVVDVWLSSMSPMNPGPIWLKLAQAISTSAMLVATASMNIKKIKSTSFDGGGDTAATPAVTALSQLQQGVSYTSNVEGASTEETVPDNRVYVVESDITDVQKNVKSTVDEATF